MKLSKLISLGIVILISIVSSCDKQKNNCVDTPTANSANCIDLNLIDSTSACFAVYEPVCGCDGETYSNSCYATTYGGVTSYIDGECCDN